MEKNKSVESTIPREVIEMISEDMLEVLNRLCLGRIVNDGLYKYSEKVSNDILTSYKLVGTVPSYLQLKLDIDSFIRGELLIIYLDGDNNSLYWN